MWENWREVTGSDEVFGSSFMIGQEPDAFRGGFDELQAFRGNMTEMNMWDYVLSDQEIKKIGTCMGRAQGNVFSWKKENFNFYNVSLDSIKDVNELCTLEKSIFIFPNRLSLPSAKKICTAHGGYLYTPRNEEENNQVFQEVSKYSSSCASSKGNVFWLGAETIYYKIYVREPNQKYVPGNYTNWDRPPFDAENDCIYMQKDGKWLSYQGCEFLELCPVCGFVGTPALTMKGT